MLRLRRYTSVQENFVRAVKLACSPILFVILARLVWIVLKLLFIFDRLKSDVLSRMKRKSRKRRNGGSPGTRSKSLGTRMTSPTCLFVTAGLQRTKTMGRLWGNWYRLMKMENNWEETLFAVGKSWFECLVLDQLQILVSIRSKNKRDYYWECLPIWTE